MAKKKIPLLAAALNILLTGLGYLYAGKRKTFAILLIAGEILSGIYIFLEPRALNLLDNKLIMGSTILYLLAFALDAYKAALES